MDSEHVLRYHKGSLCHGGEACDPRSQRYARQQLLKLNGGIGAPDGGCDHEFCLECIKEWAKNVPTCPLDREPFSNVIVKVDGREVRRERVSKKRQQVDQNEEEEENLPDPVCCEACGMCSLMQCQNILK